MAILATKGNGGTFELPPEGTYQGVVFAVWDGGMRTETFDGKESQVHKIKFGIELNETYQSGQYAGERITRYPEFTLSLSDKAKLTPVVESLLQRPLTDAEKEGYDVEKLIGKNCQVTIFHKTSKTGRQYAESKIGALMKGIAPIKPILKPDYLPEHIKKWIAEGQSVETANAPTHGEVIQDDNKAEMDAMHAEIGGWIKANIITLSDVNNTIKLQAGGLIPWGKLPIEKARIVYKKTASFVMSKTEDLTEGTGFDADTPLAPPVMI
jgi:hypothetical protein